MYTFVCTGYVCAFAFNPTRIEKMRAHVSANRVIDVDIRCFILFVGFVRLFDCPIRFAACFAGVGLLDFWSASRLDFWIRSVRLNPMIQPIQKSNQSNNPVMSIRNLEPKALWNHFANLNAVPRPSKKEERVIQFMMDFGNSLGLETIKDRIGNVVIKKKKILLNLILLPLLAVDS